MEEKPWFKQYDQGMPYSLRPYPQRTLLDIVSTTTQQRPDHIAMVFKGARIVYSELERLSDAFSAALIALGVKKGDRVALLLESGKRAQSRYRLTLCIQKMNWCIC